MAERTEWVERAEWVADGVAMLEIWFGQTAIMACYLIEGASRRAIVDTGKYVTDDPYADIALVTPHAVIVLAATQMPTPESLLKFEKAFNDYARPAKVEGALNMHANGFQQDIDFLEQIRRNPDGPNPYLWGPERFGRWMSIMVECGRARLAALNYRVP